MISTLKTLFPILLLAAVALAETPVPDLTGTWQGTLQAEKDLRTVLKITKGDGGALGAKFYSIDQGGQGIPVTKISLQGSAVQFNISMIDGTYEGKLSADGNTISGTWKQGPKPLPLVFKRTTPDTAWAIPEPPPRPKPMAADADPAFEVATVKPSKPDAMGKGFGIRGRHFSTMNTSLAEIIAFAYGVQDRQIIGAPAWVTTDKFDTEGQPDGEGQPSEKQWKGMVKKMLADRFQLKFHNEPKELAVYGLVGAKTGPKLTPSQGDPNGLPGMFFRGIGNLTCTNANMDDFSRLMQSSVLDKPVVDQTGIKGRYDFTLKWTPDETQFGGMGLKIPPPSDPANAPPGLFTAMQEQLGLKFDNTKASVPVMVIDHVEKPSAN